MPLSKSYERDRLKLLRLRRRRVRLTMAIRALERYSRISPRKSAVPLESR